MGYRQRNTPRWSKFPLEWKREYLHYKVQQDAESPSVFSRVLRRLADKHGQGRTTEEEYALIDKLMDGWIVNAVKMNPYRDLPSSRFLPSEVEDLLESSDSSPLDEGIVLQQVLAISAIVRGDFVEFQRILDETSGLEVQSPLVSLPRFRQDFLSIECSYLNCALLYTVGTFGNADIMRVLLANQRPNSYTQRKWLRGHLAAWTTKEGNRDGLKVLIEHLAAANEDEVSIFPWTPRKTLSHRLRDSFLQCFIFDRPHMVDTILDCCGEYCNNPDLHFDILMQAIRSSKVAAVQYALKKAHPQINRQTRAYNYHSPLFFALFTLSESKRTRGGITRDGRKMIMKTLLESGADLLQTHRETKKTVLQYAIEKKRHSTIEFILNYETELYGTPSVLSGDSENRSFWLRTAFHGRCFFLIDLLVQNGVTRFKGKRRSYDARMVDSSEDEISDDEDAPDWVRDLNSFRPRRWSKMPIHFYLAPMFDDHPEDSQDDEESLDSGDQELLDCIQSQDDDDCVCRPWCSMER